MKKILIVLFLGIFNNIQAQYSTYYNVDVNQKTNINANINQNVNVTGSVYQYKTVRTIDYGALELANAQKEKNRLENQIYIDEKQKQISIEIASDPLKAFDYGYKISIPSKGKVAKDYGFKRFSISYRVPHSSLFVLAGSGRFENVSIDGVTTEIVFYTPEYNKDDKDINVEEIAKSENLIVGKLMDVDGMKNVFIHKKEIQRATVYGVKGFKYSMIWEDDYQYSITDIFISFDRTKKNGIEFFVKVKTYGSKSEIDFEQLEGRRFYLKRLIEKIVSTALIYDIKY